MLEVALRVLVAFSAHRSPDPADLERLRSMAPQLAHLPPDELARDLVYEALHRESKRQQARGVAES